LSFCNNDTFQIYLNDFSEQEPNEFKIIVLDNGAFHKSKALKIPNNIGLIFLPPYCPELNPAERMWGIIKANFTGQLFKNLEQLSDFIESQVNQLTEKAIISTCSYPYIFEYLNWTI
jgi:transposase